MVLLEMGGQRPLRARGINISVGGLLCCTDEAVDPLTRMRISLALPDEAGRERQLEVEGTVLHYRSDWQDGFAIGIHFDGIGARERRMIGEYIAGLNEEEEELQ
jgi:c-di-GMP-binding flagellar brake protein YcgR